MIISGQILDLIIYEYMILCNYTSLFFFLRNINNHIMQFILLFFFLILLLCVHFNASDSHLSLATKTKIEKIAYSVSLRAHDR